MHACSMPVATSVSASSPEVLLSSFNNGLNKSPLVSQALALHIHIEKCVCAKSSLIDVSMDKFALCQRFF